MGSWLGPVRPRNGLALAASEARSGDRPKLVYNEKPNLLKYLNADDGLQLGAIEWGAPVEAVPQNPDLFADTDGSEPWHVHEAATHGFGLSDDTAMKPQNVPLEA